ncbi:MAG TPA: endolytic transglycosylase MltG [Burkholderiales bacterium]|jgi:UPF0755 protein|nr:endolytic transglycosylase MltG [Burkholderiales bacterium]
MIRKFLIVALGAVVIGAGAFAGILYYYARSALPVKDAPAQFSLRAGSSLKSAARQMAEAGLLHHPAAFVLLGRIFDRAGAIKAGSYEFQPGLTPWDLLQKISRGDVTLMAVTFPEGSTFRQWRGILDGHPKLKHETTGWQDGRILEALAIDAKSPEGWFFPDTYHVSEGTSDLVVLRRAHQLMGRHLATHWEGRAPGLPLATPYDALILASIVEKETGREDDRPLVAAVFVNRLRKGMLLQADPTVIYGLGEQFDGNLRKGDLLADTPYNTYTRSGLPPTPIAMPGLASLSVTLNPPDSDVLYFVSRGDGSSHFSRTLTEHDRAVTKYQRSGRR